jgi:hypothetical protein
VEYSNTVINSQEKDFLRCQPVYHDVKMLTPDMQFNMKQYPNSMSFVKKFVKDKKLFYIRPVDIEKLKEIHAIEDFELTIFYTFQLNDDSNNEREYSLPPKLTRTHNVFIHRTKQPVVVLYNPFQHEFLDLQGNADT